MPLPKGGVFVDRLRQNIGQLLASISFLLDGKFIGPALVVIYSTIDVLAWLDRPVSKADSDRSDFVQWVDRYLLPGHDFNVDAIDLYAARCSILHSYTSISSLSRNRQAREICYAWGTASKGDLQATIDPSDRDAVAIQLDDLLDALEQGADSFLAAFEGAPGKHARAEMIFTNVPL